MITRDTYEVPIIELTSSELDALAPQERRWALDYLIMQNHCCRDEIEAALRSAIGAEEIFANTDSWLESAEAISRAADLATEALKKWVLPHIATGNPKG